MIVTTLVSFLYINVATRMSSVLEPTKATCVCECTQQSLLVVVLATADILVHRHAHGGLSCS
jgi:hypothetical protein